jgi:hypothetical protein
MNNLVGKRRMIKNQKKVMKFQRAKSIRKRKSLIIKTKMKFKINKYNRLKNRINEKIF